MKPTEVEITSRPYELVPRDEALKSECGLCHAAVGHPCRYETDEEYEGIHLQRHAAAFHARPKKVEGETAAMSEPTRTFDQNLHDVCMKCPCKSEGKFPCNTCSLAWHQAWDLAEGKIAKPIAPEPSTAAKEEIAPGEIAYGVYRMHLVDYHSELAGPPFDLLEQRYQDAWNAAARAARSQPGRKSNGSN